MPLAADRQPVRAGHPGRGGPPGIAARPCVVGFPGHALLGRHPSTRRRWTPVVRPGLPQPLATPRIGVEASRRCLAADPRLSDPPG